MPRSGQALVGEDETLTARPGRVSRWAVVAVACVALGAVGVAGERLAVDAGARELEGASTRIEAQARAGADRIGGVVAYAGPSLTSGAVPSSVRDDLVLLVRGAAEQAAADVVSVVPAPPFAARWHAPLRTEREALERRAQVLADELRRTGRQYTLSSERPAA